MVPARDTFEPTGYTVETEEPRSPDLDSTTFKVFGLVLQLGLEIL